MRCVSRNKVEHIYLSSTSSSSQECRTPRIKPWMHWRYTRCGECGAYRKCVKYFDCCTTSHIQRIFPSSIYCASFSYLLFLSLLPTYNFLVLDVFIISVFRWAPLCSQRHSIGNGIGASRLRERDELLRNSKNKCYLSIRFQFLSIAEVKVTIKINVWEW